MSNRAEIGKQELLETIIEASWSRPVVPFIGSGVSISAGYPPIKLVIQYLAKVDFSIRLGVFQDQFGLSVEMDIDKAKNYLKRAAKEGSGCAAHNSGTLYIAHTNEQEKSRHWYGYARSLGFQPGTE